MPLERADLERIGSYVKDHLSDWLVEVATPLAMGPQIMERFARVEERIVDVDERLLRLDGRVAGLNDRMLVVQDELKHQRELIATRFEASDKRFAETRWMMGGVVVLLATMMSLYQFLG